MAWNYDKEYKDNIRKAILTVKTNSDAKKTPIGIEIRELKQECIRLLDSIGEFPYKPNAEGTTFFVTESRAGFNKEIFDDVEKLKEIHRFLSFFKTN